MRHSMELVGFGADSQRRIFGLLSAVLLLGNVQYTKVGLWDIMLNLIVNVENDEKYMQIPVFGLLSAVLLLGNIQYTKVGLWGIMLNLIVKVEI